MEVGSNIRGGASLTAKCVASHCSSVKAVEDVQVVADDVGRKVSTTLPLCAFSPRGWNDVEPCGGAANEGAPCPSAAKRTLINRLITCGLSGKSIDCAWRRR